MRAGVISDDGFHIERCAGAGCTNFVRVATVGRDVTGYLDSLLRHGHGDDAAQLSEPSPTPTRCGLRSQRRPTSRTSERDVTAVRARR